MSFDCEIRLELPSAEHKSRAEEFKSEFFSNGEEIINGSSLFDKMDFDDWLAYAVKNRDEKTVSSEWVTATVFFGVRNSDEKIIGIIDVRHNLNNTFLKEYGGHIGYSVRPSERCKGYASRMLSLALCFTDSLLITEVMIGCYESNTASIRVIERCGGRLSERKFYSDGNPMRIYKIYRGVSVCGAECFECDKYLKECGGCRAIEGKVCWTEFTNENVCGIYDCCMNKKISDCGKCDLFPCWKFKDGDPTKTDEENREILRRQIDVLKSLSDCVVKHLD
ncbi:MAG: GNAT family N-acetyltransferase [Methanocorpusculum sp.]|nr:GNAT family N-acetyltransferase [Methanocorpusculum sp.]